MANNGWTFPPVSFGTLSCRRLSVPGTPTVLFKGTYFNETGSQWDVTPDGNRFLMLKPAGANGAAAGDQARPQIVLVQNWFEELKRLVPVK